MTLAEFMSRGPGAQALVAVAFSLGMSLTAGPGIIRWLQRFAGERIDSASQKLDEFHADKRGTPTMGGILIVGCTGNAIWMVAEHSLPIAMLAMFLLLSLAGWG